MEGFLKGILLGLGVSVPIGPINVLIMSSNPIRDPTMISMSLIQNPIREPPPSSKR